MINIEKAKEEFRKYVSNYNPDDFKISLKINHSFRVAEYARILAKELGVNEDFSELIGLLHDIGRFEQIRRYDTFDDRKSIDHADLGAEILAENNYVANYCDEEYKMQVIIDAVRNHNKYKIDDKIAGEELVYCRIVRDADKIDILNYMDYEDVNQLYMSDTLLTSKISDEVMDEMVSGIVVNRYKSKTKIDSFVSEIGFIYDINYSKSIEIIKKNNSINKMFDIVKDSVEKERLDIIKDYIINYMESRIK